MTKLGRLFVGGAASLAMLVGAGSALAAYTSPRLTILNPSERLGGGGPLTIRVAQDRAHDATWRVSVFVPQGYVSSLVPRVGQRIGNFAGSALVGERMQSLTGAIVAVDPAPFKTNQASVTCNGDDAFDSVWMLRLSGLGGQTWEVPVYVSTITQPPEAAYASGKLVFCLPSPYTPPGQGGAPSGAKLVTANLTLLGLFANPATRGRYVWRAMFTPWNTTRLGLPNVAGTVETRAIDAIGIQLTTNVAARAARTVTLRGRLTNELQRGMRNVAVQILRGTTARNVKRVATVRTNSTGFYTARISIPATGAVWVRARASQPARAVNGCTNPRRTNPAVNCLRTVHSGFTLMNNRRVRVR